MQFLDPKILKIFVQGTVNTVNTAPSSVPQVDEASLESRNAITIDDRANKTGLGES
jgi:hypothetical protein